MRNEKEYIPPLMLPQNRKAFEKFNQSQWKNPLPSEYKKVAKALQSHEIDKIPLEEIINPNKNRFVKELYDLAVIALDRRGELNYLLDKFEIISKHTFLDEWIARVLIAELLWGKHILRSGAKEVEAIKYYEEDLRETFLEVTNIVQNPIDNNKFKFPTYIRINTLSITIEDSIRAFCKEGWNLLPRCNTYSEYLRVLTRLDDRDFMRDHHISEVLVFPPGTELYGHPGYVRGKFLIQDKGSCLSSFLLNPKPGSVVLDMCAAVGLKTNHLANIMNNNGLIYANDIHPTRNERMRKLLDLTNVKCVETLEDDYLEMKINNIEDIKYVLIDPSCSFSGIFYEVSKSILKAKIHRNQNALSMLLRHTLQNFPNLKRLVFTTCSVYPEEGETVVEEALKEVGNSYTLLNVREMLWNEWESVNSADYACANQCLRIVPEVDLCHGYFIAVFERNFDVPVPPYEKKFRKGSKLYSADEMEKIEKLSLKGKLIQTWVPKEKLEKANQEQPAAIPKKVNKNSMKKKKYLAKVMRNQRQIRYIQPNLNVNSAPSHSNFSAPQQNYNLSTSQLYP